MVLTFTAAATIFEIPCKPLEEIVGEQKQDSFSHSPSRLVVGVAAGADINQVIASVG